MLEQGILSLQNVSEDDAWKDYLGLKISETLNEYRSIDDTRVNNVISGIREHLGDFVCKANYMFFEKEYNETAWKDMVALYYVHSDNYIKSTVMRVHLFKGDKDTYILTDDNERGALEKNYLGYFNIRPIIDKSACVSYAMVNYASREITYFEEQSGEQILINMITYDRMVHICGFPISMKTFPYFGRDNKIVVCAQADMLMMSRFIYRKLHMPELTLQHICQNMTVDRLDIFPTRGITTRQILDIFFRRDIFVRHHEARLNDVFSIDLDCLSTGVLGQLVLSYLDSNLPVFIVWKQHIVIANGISSMLRKKDGNPPDRVIALYDDSSALIKDLSGGKGMRIPFFGLCTWQEIEEAIKTNAEQDRKKSKIDKLQLNQQNDNLKIEVIVPMYQRVTLDYIALVEVINSSDILKATLFQGKYCINDPNVLLSSALWRNSRVFLTDCNTLKEKLLSVAAEYLNEIQKTISMVSQTETELVASVRATVKLSEIVMKRLLSSGIPHYYWCLEMPYYFDMENSVFYYYFFDASPSVRNDIETVCLNIISVKEQMEILSDDEIKAIKTIDESRGEEDVKMYVCPIAFTEPI